MSSLFCVVALLVSTDYVRYLPSSVYNRLIFYKDIKILSFFADPVVSFTAYLSSSLRDYNSRIVVYDSTVTNQGLRPAYNTKTGYFTAPSSGTYFFTWNSFTLYGNKCNLLLYSNEVYQNVSAFADGTGSKEQGHDSSSNSLFLTLIKGDTVHVQTGTCDVLFSFPHTFFSGFKI